MQKKDNYTLQPTIIAILCYNEYLNDIYVSHPKIFLWVIFLCQIDVWPFKH